MKVQRRGLTRLALHLQSNAIQKLRDKIGFKEEFSSVVEACIRKKAPE